MKHCTREDVAPEMPRGKFRPLQLVAALSVAGLAQSAQAIDFTWLGGNGDWSIGSNWSPVDGPPGGRSDDQAIINSGSAALGSAATVSGLTMTGGQLAGIGKLTVSGTTTLTDDLERQHRRRRQRHRLQRQRHHQQRRHLERHQQLRHRYRQRQQRNEGVRQLRHLQQDG